MQKPVQRLRSPVSLSLVLMALALAGCGDRSSVGMASGGAVRDIARDMSSCSQYPSRC